MGRMGERLTSALTGQRGHLFPWCAVALAGGIGTYFALPEEPPVWGLVSAACAGSMLLALSLRLPAWFAPLAVALALVVLGIALAGGRAHLVSGPQLGFRYYGPVEGRVVGIDRSASDALRLTLDRVVLDRMAPHETPRRVRVSLHGQEGTPPPRPGDVAILTGHLSPPAGAAEPGGFDFRRHAWFLRLGAVGYTRTPVLRLAPAQRDAPVLRLRLAIAERVRAALPGETGAFAAAIMTGDRSAISLQTLQALRHSNLAHLLAISGLHMGLLAGVVFGATRLALLLPRHSRHNWPGKKIAAAVALVAAAGYLALSGGNVATQRAFVMVAVMLVALLCNRRALSLRSVALAALIVLVLRPEALLGPGFQMSFAATLGLVAVFGAMRDLAIERGLPRLARPVLTLVVSSVTASLATAPVSMAHFNIVSHYGLVANLVAVPVMGLIVVPMAVVTALMMPLGLEALPLSIMALGLDWILTVAGTVTSWDGALGQVRAPGAWVLPLLAAGGLILCLWQGRGRWAGLAPLSLAVVLWASGGRPALLISDSGTLVGAMTSEGRALSRERGAGFVARVWLENDGQAGGQAVAAALWPEHDQPRVARISVAGAMVTHFQGKRAAAGFRGCGTQEVVVSSADLPDWPGCEIFDPERLARTGAVAIWPGPSGPRIETAAGQRLWHRGADR
jgi:competence protein ComEC